MNNESSIFTGHPYDHGTLVRRNPDQLLPAPDDVSSLYFLPRAVSDWRWLMRPIGWDVSQVPEQWTVALSSRYSGFDSYYASRFACGFLTRLGFRTQLRASQRTCDCIVTDPRAIKGKEMEPEPPEKVLFSYAWLRTILSQREVPSSIVRGATLGVCRLLWIDAPGRVRSVAEAVATLLAGDSGVDLRGIAQPEEMQIVRNVVRCAAELETATAAGHPAHCLDGYDFYQLQGSGRIYQCTDPDSDLEGLWVVDQLGTEYPVHLLDSRFNIRVRLGVRTEVVECDHCGDTSIEAGSDEGCLILGCHGTYQRTA